jgi:hypothetical protein
MLELLFLVCTVTRICNEDLNNGDKLLLITHREKLHSAPTCTGKTHMFHITLERKEEYVYKFTRFSFEKYNNSHDAK